MRTSSRLAADAQRQGDKAISYLAPSLAILLVASPAIAQTVVLDARPTVKVESAKEVTKRYVLPESEQRKYQVTITKRNDRYVWTSRENRELIHRTSGAFHYFIDPYGGGYVKVFDTNLLPKFLRDPGPRFSYMEHLTHGLGTITYWGATDQFHIDR